MRFVLYLVFIVSGAAGLIYESIWSRYLGLFVGHSAYAQVIVLTIFLGGMSLGAFVIGQRAERLRAPLLWYAGIELLVGLIGFLFHTVYLGVTYAAYTWIFPMLTDATMLTVVKWSMAATLILPQSVLLGATFPCMSAGLMRQTAGSSGRLLAVLYGANSLGAAGGVLLEGFWLLHAVGLPGTILAAACCNVVAAAVTYLIARRETPDTVAVPETVAPPRAELTSLSGLSVPRLWWLLLGVSFVTALASFVYEIAWIRMLSLVLGSATHSFELMLSAFILGLACGAWWVRQRVDRLPEPLLVLGRVQWIMGCLALLTLPIYLASFTWMGQLLLTFGKTDQGYVGFHLARYGLCLAVMLPATFCAGMTLPLITHTLLRAGTGERAIGWVYGVNTLGSIAGVILASLYLLPWLGLKALLMLGAACDMVVGVGIVAALAPAAPARRPWRLVAVASGVTVLYLGLIAWGTSFDQLVMTSGVFRRGTLLGQRTEELLFYQDGRTATVSAARSRRNGTVFISTNGKPDASLRHVWFQPQASTEGLAQLSRDDATQVLLGLILLAHAPQGRQAAVIGHGSGQSSHLLLGSPALERLVTIEIEPAIIEGSRVFHPINRRVFEDPRSVTVVEDARAFFASSQQRYDLILSEPSNPWVSGVSSLFTTEFYALVAPRLTAQGVFGQWLHLYELTDDLVINVLAALHQHFASYQLFELGNADILIVASHSPHLPRPDWSVATLPGIADDLKAFHPLTPESLDTMRLLDRAALVPLLSHYDGANSDFYPALDLGAEKARYLGDTAAGLIKLGVERFMPFAPFFESTTPLGALTSIPVSHNRLQMRARSVALRLGREQGALPAGLDDAETRIAMQRVWQWESALAAERPPADWQLWVHETLRVEADLHGDATGAIDVAFYDTLHQYLARHTPPAAACDALLFREGLARWDFAVVSAAADRLLPTVKDTTWVPIDQLRDGAVVAKLLRGDVAGARAYYAALAGKGERSNADFRTRLLEAYLQHADTLPRLPAVQTSMPWTCPGG